ncbi:MAG: hypothetical protein HFE51_09905 [Clostridia bacterium]|nr:hypothetical protein [Clostridia bacterium]MCI8979385.1 hypothetical protein [Clostridia bacterium]MCI9086716.1 hypothetical protein [Clostridia bacterium]NDO20319.1 hypothetical protein [Lachnospiraceae bacterium MD329]
MELDITEFVNKTKQICVVQNEQGENAMQYLYKMIASPILQGKDVFLSNIDFGKFTKEEYTEFCDSVMETSRETSNLYSVFCEAKPCSNSVRTMFF